MTCEINSNPCDVCEEPYCPDQLEDAYNKHAEIVSQIAMFEARLKRKKEKLVRHEARHPTLFGDLIK